MRPAAQVGYERRYLERASITWADTEKGRGPTGRSIRSANPSIVRNYFKPWQMEGQHSTPPVISSMSIQCPFRGMDIANLGGQASIWSGHLQEIFFQKRLQALPGQFVLNLKGLVETAHRRNPVTAYSLARSP